MSNQVQAKNTPDKQTNRCRNQQPLRKQFRVHKGQLFIASDLGLLLKERCGQDKGGQCSVVQGRQDPRRVINLGRLYLPWGPMPPARFPGKGVGAVTRELGTEPRWQHIPLGGLYSVPDRTAPEPLLGYQLELLGVGLRAAKAGLEDRGRGRRLSLRHKDFNPK